MTAYRLRFEEVALNVLALVHRGRIGDPKFFNSYEEAARPSPRQRMRRPPVRQPRLVKAGPPFEQ